MKTTLDVQDALMVRAKRYAKSTGRPLRAVVEEALRRLLDEPRTHVAYRLPDLGAGRPGDPDPLEKYSWQDLREEIYDERGKP